MKQLKATRRVLIGAGAAVAVGAAAFGASAFFKDRKPSEFNARLIVGSDTDNSIAVQWEGNGSWYLELRKSGSRDAKRFTPQPDSYTVRGEPIICRPFGLPDCIRRRRMSTRSPVRMMKDPDGQLSEHRIWKTAAH